MFECFQTLFLYALSPIHFGAGTAVGPVDSPIQREKHTGWPKANSSSLRGPLRRWLENGAGWSPKCVEAAFGPEAGGGEGFQGAVGLGDAMVLLFPVRSARHVFVYATCPAVLTQFRRRLKDITGEAAKDGVAPPAVPSSAPGPGECWTLRNGPHEHGRVVLEAFLFTACKKDDRSDLATWARWLSTYAFPESPAYFSKKLLQDLVLLHDDEFGYFVRRSTVVEPHNRIEDATGTVAERGLFYIENLPPETLLATWVGASTTKAPAKGNGGAFDFKGEDWLKAVRSSLDGKVFQAGGDATTGRGLLQARFLEPRPAAQGGQP